MSVSASSIKARYLVSSGTDPIFAAVDGANCPDTPGSQAVRPITDPNHPHSVLLNRGDFRIGLPWPPKGVQPEFTIAVVKDPTKCELSAQYGLYSANPTVSVYRRSLMAANLRFVTTIGPDAIPPGVTLPLDPAGNPESGNIMFDGREATLTSQAQDAVMGHSQAASLPNASIIQQIVDFENGIYTAQSYDYLALSLTDAGAYGGASALAKAPAGMFANPTAFGEFATWSKLPFWALQSLQRSSIARGEAIFNQRPFIISNVAGFNDLSGNNKITGTCSTCHSSVNTGNDARPQAQLNEGTTGGPFALPAPDLPLFALTCLGNATTPFDGSIVYVRDPGRALITGKCADIGKVKSAQLRGLAARAPYFHDGSATTLIDVINFYNARFNIKLSPQEQIDLFNFLCTL